MTDDSDKDVPVTGSLGFLLGQLAADVKNTTRDVANALGPRFVNLERRVERLENWRNWMTGAAAVVVLVVGSIEILRLLANG